MKTVYWQVDPVHPQSEIIQQAAQLIQNGELVAFPTETVYGLGAAAFTAPAVEKIYRAKDRPPVNPLLVHIASPEQVLQLVEHIPGDAQRLMEQFWPGPLSIILPARPEVPAIVTAHRPGVGLRMPSHPVALALITAAGPIAAPSANLSGRPSPVTAQHVRDDLDGRISAVLDGGATGLGIESTVLDLTEPEPVVLRLGGVSLDELEAVVGRKIFTSESVTAQMPHYQTRTQVLVAAGDAEMREMVVQYGQQGKRIALVHNQPLNAHRIEGVAEFYLQLDQPGGQLYSLLRDAERDQIDVLIFSPLPQHLSGMAAAMADRIYRAGRK